MDLVKKICSRCIMNETIEDLLLDQDGICQYCKIQDQLEKDYPINEKKIIKICEKIKIDGKNKKYDCVAGTSGGADSTYVLYIAKKYGLNPLVVHLDNGWNSEIAVQNIKKSLVKLNLDLKTHVIDWDEFKDIQLSFLKASVSDGEVPTDLAIRALLYNTANQINVKYIITGSNFRTEGGSPQSWTYMDGKYIESVQKNFGSMKIKTFPNISFYKQFYYNIIKKINVLKILNYVPYNKNNVKKLLNKELDWQDYGAKHFESIYTKFYQSYILYNKFNIDKRLTEYSALIRSGQIKREKAIKIINNPPYNKDEIEFEKSYILKKLMISEEEFEEIMNSPIKSFKDYKTNHQLKENFSWLYKQYKRIINSKF